MFAMIAAAAAVATPAPTVDYATAVVAPGRWNYAPATAGSSASFTAPPAAAKLTLRCNRAARQVAIALPASGAAPHLYVWTSSTSRNLPAGYDPATRLLTAQLSAWDRLLDALAFSRGRVVVAAATGGTLVAPAWPEIARVIEDCRV